MSVNKYDDVFLSKLMKDKNRVLYAKIYLLNNDERPIANIEGKVQSGSISLNGNSTNRRTSNLTVTLSENTIKENGINAMLCTKYSLSIGLENHIDK
jgi:hypothetical protein